MTRRQTIPALLLTVLMALSGCGDAADSALGQALRGVAAGVGAGRGEAPADPRQVLTRAQLANVDTPLILVVLDRADVAATLARAGQNGPHVTYLGGDGNAVILAGDLLTGTRGLGDDLMTAEIGEVRAALSGARSEALRVHRRLNGSDQIALTSYVCRYARDGAETITIIGRNHVTTRVRERCRSADEEIENVYWIGSGGEIWRSRQWVSPGVGSLTIDHLVR